jgi:hypothetical protein
LANQSVNLIFTVTEIPSLDKVLELPFPEAAVGVVQLERPEEIGCLFEIWSDRVDWQQG